LYWFRHQHGSGGCLFLLDPPVVVGASLWLMLVIQLVLVVAQVLGFIVAHPLVLAGGEVATDPSDVVESALVRALS